MKRSYPTTLCVFLGLSACELLLRAEGWQLPPEAVEQAGVPRGWVQKMEPWHSKIYPGTVRDWWVYLPAQVKGARELALMVFQDGHDYVGLKGHWRVPTVFDNLTAKGEMPPTVAVFVNPGHETSQPPAVTPWKSSNRSLEYDSRSERYARFLTEELLPEVERVVRARGGALSRDPELRAVGGASSGAVCAFTVAWERPDSFRKVFSTIGSFVNLRGGHTYPSLIRKTEPKPLRVYLAECSGDLDNAFGNWPLANQEMNSALRYMGYDVRFDFAEGFGHDSDHGGSVFPEAMKWLWRREKAFVAMNNSGDTKGDLSLLSLIPPGEGWKVAAEGLGFADAPCSDAEGNFYFSDTKAPAIYRIGVDGTRSRIASEGVSGLKFGSDGWLYGCQGGKKRVIAVKPENGEVREVATGVQPNDLVITPEGYIYITETGLRQITFIDSKSGAIWVADHGLSAPNGLALSPDGGTLAVSEYRGEHVWVYRLEGDGTLSAKSPYMTLSLPIDAKGESRLGEPPPYQSVSKGDGLCNDWRGRYYVTSALGVQVFDPTGRLCGVFNKPQASAPLTSCTLGGVQRDVLFVTNGDKVYSRKLQIETVRSK
jgi:sugar lactone lactonase YvrE/enterochelin esterase-like enzyme